MCLHRSVSYYIITIPISWVARAVLYGVHEALSSEFKESRDLYLQSESLCKTAISPCSNHLTSHFLAVQFFKQKLAKVFSEKFEVLLRSDPPFLQKIFDSQTQLQTDSRELKFDLREPKLEWFSGVFHELNRSSPDHVKKITVSHKVLIMRNTSWVLALYKNQINANCTMEGLLFQTGSIISST